MYALLKPESSRLCVFLPYKRRHSDPAYINQRYLYAGFVCGNQNAGTFLYRDRVLHNPKRSMDMQRHIRMLVVVVQSKH